MKHGTWFYMLYAFMSQVGKKKNMANCVRCASYAEQLATFHWIQLLELFIAQVEIKDEETTKC